jgi:phosphoglycerate-specific signal transduction histidine kinase
MSTQLKIAFKLWGIFILTTSSIAWGTYSQEYQNIANAGSTGYRKIHPELEEIYKRTEQLSRDNPSKKMISAKEAEILLEKCANLMADENTPWE